MTTTKIWVAVQWTLALSVLSSAISMGMLPVGAQEKAEGLRGEGRNLPRLSEIKRSLTSAQILVQSPAPVPSEIVQVTGVKANPTNQGVEVILQTILGQLLPLVNRSADNSYIADIPNAQLRLPSGEVFVFRSQKPIAGITEITVTNIDANTIRVTVTGEAGVPTVELFDSPEEGLIFSVVSAAASTPPQQPPQKPTPPKVESGSETQPDQPSAAGEEEIEVVVTGEQETGYSVPNASVGTRTDTPLRDIPQSIQVVPRQVIEDQQITRLSEALRNVPGVVRGNQSTRSPFDSFLIRGFNTRNFLRNGLIDDTNLGLGSETVNLERIEVLKGPASVLYGQGASGGTINLVTKQPLSEPYYSIEGFIGNFDFYRGSFDISGPLNADKTLLYRLNAAAQTAESFVDFFDSQRYFISPVLTWLVSDRTKLTFEAELLYDQTPFDQGIPAVGSVLFNPNGNISRDRYVGEPSDREYRNSFRIGYDFEHRFSDNWQIRSAFRTSIYRTNEFQTFGLGPDLVNNRSIRRTFSDGNNTDIDVYNLDNYAVGRFKTYSIQHQLVAGFNLLRQVNSFSGISRSIASLDVFNPVYGQPLGPRTDPFNTVTRIDRLGIYLQDQITLLENLKLLLGGRFDIVSQEGRNFIASTISFQQDEAFSPQIGIVYQPISEISLYASYSRSFQQVSGRSLENTLFNPERGTQYEIGIKADLNPRVSTTLALYNLTRSNVLITDLRDTRLFIQTGEQRSRGIEFDITGEILPGWNIIAGYAFTDAEIVRDNPSQVGNQLNNVPKHSLNLWTTYEIQSGDLKGLGFGVGFFSAGDRQGDLANTFELPNYFRTDAAIFYKQGGLRVALNVRNLFDVDYFESAQSRTRVFPGDPLIVQGTIAWEF